MAVAAKVSQLALDQRLGLVELSHRGDHREHQLELAPAGGAQQRAHLAAQEAGPVEPEPDRAPAQGRVLLLDIAHVGQDLVAADVERAEGHGLFAGGVKHRAVE